MKKIYCYCLICVLLALNLCACQSEKSLMLKDEYITDLASEDVQLIEQYATLYETVSHTAKKNKSTWDLLNFQDELTAIYNKMEPISYYGMPEHIVALKWDISRFQAILLTVAVSKDYGELNGASGDPKLTGLTYLAEELGLSIDTVSEQADLLDQVVISYIVEQLDITIATYFK